MKIEVSKDDLKLILQNTLDRVHTCDEFKRLEKAVEGPKIHVEARRWFQKTYGNTYHSVKVYINNELVYHNPREYGYGDQWLQTAIDWLSSKGYCDKQYGTLYFRGELGGTYHVLDVDRKRDL